LKREESEIPVTYKTLDALRGIAAVSVVIGHYSYLFSPLNIFGLFSVDLFFAMSGFVIAHAYERKLANGLTSCSFFKLRAVRLYPLYFLGTVLGVGYAGADGLALLPASACAVIMLPCPIKSDIMFPLNPVSWSLFLEVVINMIFAVTWRQWTSRNLVAWLIPSSLFLIWTVYFYGSLDTGWGLTNLLGGVGRVCFSFPVGVLAYRIYMARPIHIPLGFWIAILSAVLLSARVRWPAIAQAAVTICAIPLLLFIAVNNEPPAFLDRLCKFLGQTSYAVYALHFPLILIEVALLRYFGFDIATAAPWTGMFVLALLLPSCWMIDRVYDGPIRRQLSSMKRSRKSLARFG
jgi:peptidoglycan/LPS O-acetylase OafA/YrhL